MLPWYWKREVFPQYTADRGNSPDEYTGRMVSKPTALGFVGRCSYRKHGHFILHWGLGLSPKVE